MLARAPIYVPVLVVLSACGQELEFDADDHGWIGGEKATVCASGGSYTTIQSAIDAASSGATITICAGSYRERLTVSGKSLTLTGESATTTTIDLNSSGSALKLTSGASVTVSALKITKAKTGAINCKDSTLTVSGVNFESNKGSYGGGVYGYNCTINISGSTFTSNSVSSRGGGVYADSSTGSISGNTFTTNKASSKGGGVALKNGTVTVSENSFSGNSGTHGGGVYIEADSDILDNSFTSNTCTYHGGGVYSESGDGDYSGNTFTSNAAGEDGGGLYLNKSYASVTENEFTANTAIDDAGALRALSSYATIDGNLFDSNAAGDGGGAAKISHKYGTFSNNVVRDNVAVTFGGGLVLDEDSTPVSGCLFEGNSAAVGGGMYVAGGWREVAISDTEFSENNASTKGGGLAIAALPYGASTERVTFTSNLSPYGAAIHADTSKLIVENTLIHWNQASANGGGIYALSGETSILNSVFYRNSAPWASALYAYNLTGDGVRNSVVYKNLSGVAVVLAAGTLGWNYNDHYNHTVGHFSGMSDPRGTNGNLAVNPNFGDASGNDFELTSASTLINAGDPATAYNDADGSRNDMGIYGGPGAL